MLQQLEAAISRRDKSEIARLIASPCLCGYPVSRNWSEIARRAQQDVAAIEGLIGVLAGDRRGQLLEMIDARLIRENRSAFMPYQERLREWLPEEVLPAAKMRLCTPLGRKALTKDGNSANTYRICWSWPDPRFCDQCLMVVLPRPAVGARSTLEDSRFVSPVGRPPSLRRGKRQRAGQCQTGVGPELRGSLGSHGFGIRYVLQRTAGAGDPG